VDGTSASRLRPFGAVTAVTSQETVNAVTVTAATKNHFWLLLLIVSIKAPQKSPELLWLRPAKKFNTL
jgi:hypothetical protein